jgi:hypothetical protein
MLTECHVGEDTNEYIENNLSDGTADSSTG